MTHRGAATVWPGMWLRRAGDTVVCVGLGCTGARVADDKAAELAESSGFAWALEIADKGAWAGEGSVKAAGFKTHTASHTHTSNLTRPAPVLALRRAAFSAKKLPTTAALR